MRKVGIIGGETHIGEVTGLAGKSLQIVGATVRPDQHDWAASTFGAPVFASVGELLAEAHPDMVAIANENDLKAQAVLQALKAGCDVVVDKPLALTMDEQQPIERFLAEHPAQRLLMLLTLRGNSEYTGLRQVVQSGAIGAPAFVAVRMAVRLKRAERPPWFLDVNRSGGLFLDLLIHGLDQVEWVTGQRIVAMTGVTGNLGAPEDVNLRDHAAVFCELSGGGSALVEGQRMLPDTVGSDYRILVAGTEGFADLKMGEGVTVSSPAGANVALTELPEAASVVADWLAAEAAEAGLVPQGASLRANRLALLATQAAVTGQGVPVD
ncbi:MAG: Gfo/Idh/MocA family oxidoreductase [Armatimonadetes bacterium]|nr:Gfo/Idh/MocA family oxidoreductase [Armatimonadota bacterium]